MEPDSKGSREMHPGRSPILVHHNTPLVVRASLPRTFLSLGISAEVILIFAGVYLLLEALKKPLEAGPSSVIGAALLLSLAAILHFYLARPKRHALSREDDAVNSEQIPESRLTNYRGVLQARDREEEAMLASGRLPGPM